MPTTKRKIEDYPEWLRPYLVQVKFKWDKIKTGNQFYYKVGEIPLYVILENNYKGKNHWKITGKCVYCQKEFENTLKDFQRRKFEKNVVSCGKCAAKKNIYTDEWKEKNRQAQLKVQGTPEARSKMSILLKNLHKKDPNLSKKISKSLKEKYKNNYELRNKISQASKNNWNSPEYQEKVTGNGFYNGYLNSRCGKIYFASSWELMLLIWLENNLSVTNFERCIDKIDYKKPCGTKARYHPDFLIKFKDGGNQVIEVKGSRSDIDLTDRKIKAAREFYENKNIAYIILHKQDLIRMGIFLSDKKVLPWIMELKNKGIIEYNGKNKKNNNLSI